jgi:hypothetical protein
VKSLYEHLGKERSETPEAEFFAAMQDGSLEVGAVQNRELESI